MSEIGVSPKCPFIHSTFVNRTNHAILGVPDSRRRLDRTTTPWLEQGWTTRWEWYMTWLWLKITAQNGWLYTQHIQNYVQHMVFVGLWDSNLASHLRLKQYALHPVGGLNLLLLIWTRGGGQIWEIFGNTVLKHTYTTGVCTKYVSPGLVQSRFGFAFCTKCAWLRIVFCRGVDLGWTPTKNLSGS